MMDVLLVGAGYMAKEYVKVLDALNVNYSVVGRSKESGKNFEAETGKSVLIGGLETVFEANFLNPTHAIIATSLESLEENTLYLLQKGIRNILVEKPASVTYEGMQKIGTAAEKYHAKVYIAYNRRFYASVMKAEKLIEKDGGLQSFSFEFTEWSHVVENLNKTTFQLNNWFIGNSTHVLDTAFYIGGRPKEIKSFVQSKLDWHPKGSIFVGAGVTEQDIPFSYHANWQAPGSWKLELLTHKNRYIFRPFEKLHVQRLGQISIEEICISDELDSKYKPGLYEQTNAFLFNTSLSSNLLDINTGLEMVEIYERMNGVER
ncbi:Gfo/Idh/MocA family oxidoreductase [Psychrobacillus sp. FSL H8-0483]|uniref:Gfo/Idh/MocA family oxidoreductase n=1 Tax=Psychrobacillus sp. FSL H8-0483 TaxID=2921389 RepID=UPI00315A078E